MAILYLLDTNTVSFYIAKKPPSVRDRFEESGTTSTAISTVTEAELCYGMERTPAAIRRNQSVDAYLVNTVILPWDSAAARTYGRLRTRQERKGRPLSVEDLMIAAHALSQQLILVTNDQAFGFVDGLKTEDWTVA